MNKEKKRCLKGQKNDPVWSENAILRGLKYLLSPFILFNRDSLHARLNSQYEAYRNKKKNKKII